MWLARQPSSGLSTEQCTLRQSLSLHHRPGECRQLQCGLQRCRCSASAAALPLPAVPIGLLSRQTSSGGVQVGEPERLLLLALSMFAPGSALDISISVPAAGNARVRKAAWRASLMGPWQAGWALQCSAGPTDSSAVLLAQSRRGLQDSPCHMYRARLSGRVLSHAVACHVRHCRAGRTASPRLTCSRQCPSCRRAWCARCGCSGMASSR